MQLEKLRGHGFGSKLLKIIIREFRRIRLAKEWICFSKIKKQPVGVTSWRTSKFQIKYNPENAQGMVE
jgi:GNAT superfamily N-acetyltransferase